MAARKGKDINIFTRLSDEDPWQPIAMSKSCDFNTKRDMIEISSPNSGDAKDFIPGRYEWGMNIKCLLAENAVLLTRLYLSKAKIKVMWKDSTPGKQIIGINLLGEAFIDSLKEGATIHEMASFSASLKGTGPITQETLKKSKS